jgi:hypothetical protein
MYFEIFPKNDEWYCPERWTSPFMIFSMVKVKEHKMDEEMNLK